MVNAETSQQGKTPDERVAEHVQQSPALWKIAEQCIRSTTTRTAAAREFVEIMTKGFSELKTPAGDRYTQRAVRAAMRTSKAVAGADLMPAEPIVRKHNRTWCLK